MLLIVSTQNLEMNKSNKQLIYQLIYLVFNFGEIKNKITSQPGQYFFNNKTEP